jgi:ParB-like chromosome segregation protein Spo0J
MWNGGLEQAKQQRSRRHQRSECHARLGQAEIDCVVVDLDEHGEKALNLALNKIQGAKERNKLAELIAGLTRTRLTCASNGFDASEMTCS